MKFGLTSPIYALDWTYQSDFLFVLAQYMEYDMYRNFVNNWKTYCSNNKVNKPIMLDNGAYEGELVSVDEMLNWTKNIGPDIVIAPDAYRRRHDTIEMTSEFLYSYRGNAEIMVVPQGKDDFEWLKCYYYFLGELKFDWLGLPRWLQDTPIGRPGVYQKIRTSLINHELKVHLLGLPNPVELQSYPGEGDVIKSVDTSWPFTHAKQGRLGTFTSEDRVSMTCVEPIMPAHRIQVGIDFIYNTIQSVVRYSE